jgi:hypothetical protein
MVSFFLSLDAYENRRLALVFCCLCLAVPYPCVSLSLLAFVLPMNSFHDLGREELERKDGSILCLYFLNGIDDFHSSFRTMEAAVCKNQVCKISCLALLLLSLSLSTYISKRESNLVLSCLCLKVGHLCSSVFRLLSLDFRR